jgi:hypothetical protein
MKGVMDFANHGRDDHFKEFAARASAECLLVFLREHLDVEVIPDGDDILVAGTEEKLPENPRPSALLNARYDPASHPPLTQSFRNELPRVPLPIMLEVGHGVGPVNLHVPHCTKVSAPAGSGVPEGHST